MERCEAGLPPVWVALGNLRPPSRSVKKSELRQKDGFKQIHLPSFPFPTHSRCWRIPKALWLPSLWETHGQRGRKSEYISSHTSNDEMAFCKGGHSRGWGHRATCKHASQSEPGVLDLWRDQLPHSTESTEPQSTQRKYKHDPRCLPSKGFLPWGPPRVEQRGERNYQGGGFTPASLGYSRHSESCETAGLKSTSFGMSETGQQRQESATVAREKKDHHTSLPSQCKVILCCRCQVTVLPPAPALPHKGPFPNPCRISSPQG